MKRGPNLPRSMSTILLITVLQGRGYVLYHPLLINMVAILIIAYLLPQVVRVDNWMAAIVAAFFLGVINTFIRPLLVLLTLSSPL
jgi:uncharacterized membrane protein YvlD (DUF360 family)